MWFEFNFIKYKNWYQTLWKLHIGVNINKKIIKNYLNLKIKMFKIVEEIKTINYRTNMYIWNI